MKARGGCRLSSSDAASSSPCRRVPASARLGGNIRSMSLCRHLVVPPCRRRVVVAASSPSSSCLRRRVVAHLYPHPLALTTSAGRRAVVSSVPASILSPSPSAGRRRRVAARRCGSSSPLVAASSRGLHKCIHIGIHSIHIGIHKEVSTQATSAGRRVSSVPASILTSPPGLRQQGYGCSDYERLGVQLRLQRLWQQLGLP